MWVPVYFNKTDVKPAVLDGGHEIVLENCQTISMWYAMTTIPFPSKFKPIPMFWLIEQSYAIAE